MQATLLELHFEEKYAGFFKNWEIRCRLQYWSFARRSHTKCAARTKLLFMVPDELCENLDIRSCRSKILNVKIRMGVVFCAWAKSKTIDKSLNSAWFICVNWARILNGSVFCRPVNFFIRLKIRPTPCERLEVTSYNTSVWLLDTKELQSNTID